MARKSNSIFLKYAVGSCVTQTCHLVNKYPRVKTYAIYQFLGVCLGRVGVWVVYELVSDYTAKYPDLKFPEVGLSGHCIEQAALRLS